MVTNDTQLLNLTYLENRIGELELKKWWVAESIGVDRKTLSRWLSGKIKTIKNQNLIALAECLNCQPEDLVLKDETLVIASPEEQQIAARLIVQENLLQTLTPLGQWPLLESIVKATMQPNLPLPTMGKLYNLLSICSWRQDEIDKAQGFALKAQEIGIQIGHRGVMVQAKNNLAIILSFQGKLQDSIPLYEAVIKERNFVDEDRAVAAALSNLGQDLQTFGDFDKSRIVQNQAIELYAQLKLPLNLSIAYCAVGLLENEVGNFSDAEVALTKSLEYAVTSNYVRGLSAVKFYLADTFAGTGNFLKARALLKEGFDGFKKLNLNEGLSYQIAGRIARLEKEFVKAEDLLLKGLGYSKKFPHEVAALNLEFSKLMLDQGEKTKALYFKKQAAHIYENSGAKMRLKMLGAVS